MMMMMMMMMMKKKLKSTYICSVASCYIKRKKINNEGVDEDIDSFQRGRLGRSFPLCCESQGIWTVVNSCAGI